MSNAPQNIANQSIPRLVTVCIERRPAMEFRTNPNQRRLDLLKSVVDKIKKEKWEKLDAVVFPGGFLRLARDIGHLPYDDRVNELNAAAAGFVDQVKKEVGKLDGALIVVGIDGPEWWDQLCVAVNKDGIVGIGRKIFPVIGDEAEALLCYDADFRERRRMVKLLSGRNAILCACYDMFGIADWGAGIDKRAKLIRRIGTHEHEVQRRDSRFRTRLTQNLATLNDLLTNGKVTVGIAAIHGFEGQATGYWQKHGIATCSAALKGGFAVGAAHFVDLPQGPKAYTLAAKELPEKHLRLKDLRKRSLHCWQPSYQFPMDDNSALIRLFNS
jgi:hypothetical protein